MMDKGTSVVGVSQNESGDNSFRSTQPVDKLLILYEVAKDILLAKDDKELLEVNIPDKDIKGNEKKIPPTPEDDLVLPSPDGDRILIIEIKERFDNSTKKRINETFEKSNEDDDEDKENSMSPQKVDKLKTPEDDLVLPSSSNGIHKNSENNYKIKMEESFNNCTNEDNKLNKSKKRIHETFEKSNKDDDEDKENSMSPQKVDKLKTPEDDLLLPASSDGIHKNSKNNYKIKMEDRFDNCTNEDNKLNKSKKRINETFEKSNEDDDEDKENNMVLIGSGRTKIPRPLYEQVNWNCHTAATRMLLMAVFPRCVLATHSRTGKPSPAFQNKPAKKCLDKQTVDDIIMEVVKKCKVTNNDVKLAITSKLADENKMWRMRRKKLKISS